jgi:serine/threonine protein kinase
VLEQTVQQPRTRLGDVLGPYRLIEQIGSGGMGRVYRAEHILLGRRVALKLLRQEFSERREALRRFFQEARAGSLIRHQNIVDVFDYIEVDGSVCIVMEFLTGSSLRELIRTPGALPAWRALDITAQMCEGLEAAHAAGIVHRDLKPDNIMVVADPDGADLVKILDFGIAKLTDDIESEEPLTEAGQVMGTPAYMSPEQAGASQVDARADLYGLGVMMYQMFTGQLPFNAKSFNEQVFMHMMASPTPPRSTPGGCNLDPRIEAIIMRCMDKDPSARFQSALEIRSAILSLFDPPEALPAPALAPPQAPVNPPPHTFSLRQLLPLVVIAGALLLAGIASWVGSNGGGGESIHRSVRKAIEAEVNRHHRSAASGVSAGELPAAVRVVSEPPGRVFRVGQKKALCRTPCSIPVDPSKSTASHRSYVVKRSGYHDATVAIELAALPREVSVQLERRSRATRDAQAWTTVTFNPYQN